MRHNHEREFDMEEDLLQCNRVPLQNDVRFHSRGVRMWSCRGMLDRAEADRKRRSALERMCDYVSYKWGKVSKIPWTINRGVKNLVYWFKVIWKDRDWDHAFLCMIMEHKFARMLAHRTGPNCWPSVGAHKVDRDVIIMIELLKRIHGDYTPYGHEICQKEPDPGKWHQPFDDLHIGILDNSMDHEKYMRDQDMDMFCKLFKKNLLLLWD